MSLNSHPPPPIRDPSGKIYIAIPAPAFVLAQDASVQSRTVGTSMPGYVYIEYSSEGPYSLPEGSVAHERSDLLVEDKPSVSITDWMITNCSAEPPPGHIPWTGGVPSGSMPTSTNKHGTVRPQNNLASSIPSTSTSSVSTIEIPSVDSGDTLLNGPLPSVSSLAWSEGIVPPPMADAKYTAKARYKSFRAPGARKIVSSAKPCKVSDRRRYTVCVTSTSKRREAQVFNRRRTVEKSGDPSRVAVSEINRVLSRSKAMSQIDDLDDFFSEGLKKMDETMQHFTKEQNKVEPPSLVVSTSSVIRPVSLDSSDELNMAIPSLAQRRGTISPTTLRVDNSSGLTSSTIEYPDIPTAFRVSLESSDGDYVLPKFPSVSIGPRLTTEQMISSLRGQVESLYPSCRESDKMSDIFKTQCEDAEKWLEDELECSPCKDRLSTRERRLEQAVIRKQLGNESEPFHSDRISVISHMFPLPPSGVEESDSASTPRPSQARVQSLQADTRRIGNDGTQNLDGLPIKTRLCKSILSNGSVSSGGSTKKVRFSDVPPSVIPPFNRTSRDSPTTAPSKRTPVTSPKRKPVPPVGSIRPLETLQSSLLPTPSKSSTTRKTSRSNPTSQTPMLTPKARSTFNYPVKLEQGKFSPVIGTPPRRGPLIFSSVNGTNVGESPDVKVASKRPARPLSLGSNLKENCERSLGDRFATLTKRRSYSAGGSHADKENQRESKLAELVVREAQKKGGKRSLPFQNVLSRFRG